MKAFLFCFVGIPKQTPTEKYLYWNSKGRFSSKNNKIPFADSLEGVVYIYIYI